jgi:uncharacterized protein (DUF1330 family)
LASKLITKEVRHDVYCVALINITDRQRYDTYRQGFGEIFSRYSGKLLSVEEEPDVREGNWPYTRTVLIEFPDSASFDAWYNSPEYQEALKVRLANSTGRVLLVEG